MSIRKQVKSKAANEKRNGWDQAIADAKAKIKSLRDSIRVFEARKRIGDPWPPWNSASDAAIKTPSRRPATQ
jgi:hypothetical protein